MFESAEIGRSIELSAVALPASVAAEATERARDYYTRYAVDLAWRALKERNLRSSLAQIREARKLSSTGAVVQAVGRLWANNRRLRQ